MHWFGKSDIGKSRVDNQDCFVMRTIDSENSLYIVCDGVGGARGGAVASSMISNIFADSVAAQMAERIREKKSGRLSETTIRDVLLSALHTARETLCETARSDPALSAMSTTLVVLLLMKSFAYILNIGDSRAYIYTSGSLSRLTKDHSFVQGLVDSGVLSSDEVKNYAYKNYITRSVGLSSDSTPDLYKVSLSELNEYTFLLCSDGLTNMVPDSEIEKILSGSGSAKSKTEKMIQKANRNGGLDNITVLLVSGKN